jgi:hypothetical protein
MKKYKRHANQFKVWLQDPNFKIPLDVQFQSLNGKVSGKRFKFLDKLLALNPECQCLHLDVVWGLVSFENSFWVMWVKYNPLD